MTNPTDQTVWDALVELIQATLERSDHLCAACLEKTATLLDMRVRLELHDGTALGDLIDTKSVDVTEKLRRQLTAGPAWAKKTEGSA